MESEGGTTYVPTFRRVNGKTSAMSLGLCLANRALSYNSTNAHEEEEERARRTCKKKDKKCDSGYFCRAVVRNEETEPAALGEMNKRRLRRPKVSIICHELKQESGGQKEEGPTQTAGNANTRIANPNPQLASPDSRFHFRDSGLVN